LFRGHGDASDALLRQADLALYQAKDAGRNAIRFYSPSMQALVDGRAKIETGLRKALSNQEFVLHYQPQIDRTGKLVAAEALLRWQPTGQPLVGPDTFIPVAEESGLIVPIGFWVLQSVCELLATLAQDPKHQNLRLSLNISARQFHHADFVNDVKFALEQSGARPDRLIFELTESLLLKNVDNAVQTMQTLKDIGIGFSIDDFGIGYSSLAYLKRLPLDQIKIDRSFVRDIAEDPDDRAIVQAIISLAHSLGLRVFAEGVETAAQKDFLAENNCDAYQGFLFHRPIPKDEFLQLIK
jgi:EAL domain-containing protein (putative c-di-GMP-specific phosphodiesterase class I)